MSLALYLTFSSCLKACSCSSSTIIKPKFEIGIISADLAPTITPAVPFNADNQIFFFLFFVISEFQTNGAKENFLKNLFSQSGVKTISGSKINACLP